MDFLDPKIEQYAINPMAILKLNYSNELNRQTHFKYTSA